MRVQPGATPAFQERNATRSGGWSGPLDELRKLDEGLLPRPSVVMSDLLVHVGQDITQSLDQMVNSKAPGNR